MSLESDVFLQHSITEPFKISRMCSNRIETPVAIAWVCRCIPLLLTTKVIGQKCTLLHHVYDLCAWYKMEKMGTRNCCWLSSQIMSFVVFFSHLLPCYLVSQIPFFWSRYKFRSWAIISQYTINGLVLGMDASKMHF